jgi:DNA-binding CsgD family transcriptional regulator
MGISLETVRWHLARRFARYGCVDEAQAAFPHRADIAQVR